ncbi:pirin family protein [Pontibacter qinzhouensis]|uniref:Pirin family protein n=1 Tax=Pontibacter qinzhouensis TaxID=2603253 RepID=A0A5C8IKN3_9BACT|nr:pirin family protein [Pontibacter qinzhouensis]TXK21634.1 pirin family protein [Pontibacter qinzhouensis]
MIKLITASERHEAKIGDWLISNYLFSFADFYDPSNVQFGPLRVFNHEYVAPKSSFPAAPNTEMEIVTLILSGELTYRDNLGKETKIQAGGVQRITAGTGITYTLSNESEEDELHLIQMWFLPNKTGLAPSYEYMDVEFLTTSNKLMPLVTGQKVLEDLVYLNSNSTVYFGSATQGESIEFRTFKIRKSLLYILTGTVEINGAEVDKCDHARLESQEVIQIHASADATFILVDVPALEANF